MINAYDEIVEPVSGKMLHDMPYDWLSFNISHRAIEAARYFIFTGKAADVSLPPSGSAGGDLTGTYPDPTITASAVTSGKIADGTIQRVDVAASFNAPYADTSDYALAAPPGARPGL